MSQRIPLLPLFPTIDTFLIHLSDLLLHVLVLFFDGFVLLSDLDDLKLFRFDGVFLPFDVGKLLLDLVFEFNVFFE